MLQQKVLCGKQGEDSLLTEKAYYQEDLEKKSADSAK